MKEKLLPLLACPKCAGDINLTSVDERDGAEIMTGVLTCAKCAATYPVTRGVPRFAVLEELPADKVATANNFGWEWEHFTQEDELYADQMLGWLAPVTPNFFRDKLVLEGGCGKGRHTNLAAVWGAREVVSVDLSSAVDVAFPATRHLENAHILQADIFALPLKRVFDYAFSIGVLHHLPDPRGGFISLSQKVKPGGHISGWVYGAENNRWITALVNPVRTGITSRMSQGALLQLSKLPAAWVYTATKLVYGPLNRSEGGKKIARHLFYNSYLTAISHFGWREQHHIVFDQLVAPTAFYLPRAEFAEWWEAIRAEEVTIGWHNENSWRGTGRIPADADD
jgi:SAM-dependent methyltransferase/uncharacterized protein YbaR (Trm112 family)